MPRAENQKLKALYVAKYIMEETDENHPFTATEIVEYLSEFYGIETERRSVYRDIDALIEVFGLDIESTRGGKYRLLSRQFDFDDLRLLAECVDAAKFISSAKANKLIKSLGALCSQHQRDQIKSEIFVCKRSKTTKNDILFNIGIIRGAMAKVYEGEPHTPHKITFKYLQYTIGDISTQVERRQGELYKVSPYKLMINDGNYYLLAYSDKAKALHTYRIDRMKEVKETEEPREGKEEFTKIDLENYTQRVIYMYSGRDERVSIRFIAPLLDTMIERFGTGNSASYRKDDDRHYIVSTHVDISVQFYGWLCGFGKRAKLIYPPEEVEKFKEYVDKISSMY